MGAIRTITLTDEQAEAVERLMASGACADVSDIIAAGLEALAAEDIALEKWIRAEVDPVAAELEANPSSAIPGAEVFATLRAHAAKRLGKA